MPTFNGVTIFGVTSKFQTDAGIRVIQKNDYFGLNGIEGLDGGSREQRTVVTGVLFGADVDAWNAAVALFRSYNDGLAYMMVDSKGRTWPAVRLVSFDEGEFMPAVGLGYCSIYTAVFEHMISA